jgi:hypothetical protein
MRLAAVICTDAIVREAMKHLAELDETNGKISIQAKFGCE